MENPEVRNVELMFHNIATRAVGDQGSHPVPERSVFYDVLSQLSLADPLTGLANQLLLMDRLTQALNRRQRRGGHVAVFRIYLSNLRDICDEFGYSVGDAVLSKVARNLTRALRAEDTLGRVGGSDLVAVVTISNQQDASSLAQRLKAVFDDAFVVDGRSIRPMAGLGIVIAGETETAEEVLGRAHQSFSVETLENPTVGC
jgi:diguanylate cyclase (GGDEF)-like protein